MFESFQAIKHQELYTTIAKWPTLCYYHRYYTILHMIWSCTIARMHQIWLHPSVLFLLLQLLSSSFHKSRKTSWLQLFVSLGEGKTAIILDGNIVSHESFSCEPTMSARLILYDCSIRNGCFLHYDSYPWSDVETFIWSLCFLNALSYY